MPFGSLAGLFRLRQRAEPGKMRVRCQGGADLQGLCRSAWRRVKVEVSAGTAGLGARMGADLVRSEHFPCKTVNLLANFSRRPSSEVWEV